MTSLFKQTYTFGIIVILVVIFTRYHHDVSIIANSHRDVPLVDLLNTPIAPSWIPLPTDTPKTTTFVNDVDIESVRNLASDLSLDKPTLPSILKDEIRSSVNLNMGPMSMRMQTKGSLSDSIDASVLSGGGGISTGGGRRGRGGVRGGRRRNQRGGRGGRGSVGSDEDVPLITESFNMDNNKEFEYAQSLESPSVLQGREANLAKIRARKGTILFTHIRRAGGTVLEDYVLKPFVKSQGAGRSDYLCKEGLLGRYYRMSQHQLKPYAKELAASALQWRHCPFGLHQLLPSDSFIYITMLRDPLARMVSWYAYCNKYSPNKCQAGKNFLSAGQPNDSPASKFYSSRFSLYRSGKAAFDKDHSAPEGTFHPNNLEYRLDDNYQTRMLCGGVSHEHPIPIGQDVEDCAMSNLEKYYAFVAVTERYTESICVLAAMINIPAQLKNVKNDKATTMTKKEPSDFRKNWGDYLKHDDILYKEAHRRLDKSVSKYPSCRPN